MLALLLCVLCTCSCATPSKEEQLESELEAAEMNLLKAITERDDCFNKWRNYYSLWKKDVGSIFVDVDEIKSKIRTGQSDVSQAIKFVWKKRKSNDFKRCVNQSGEDFCAYVYMDDFFPDDECGASTYLATGIQQEIARNDPLFYNIHKDIDFKEKGNYLVSSVVFMQILLRPPEEKISK